MELAADVKRWLADEPVSAWREPLSLRARRWLRRHRTAAAAFSGLLVALVGLGIALRYWQRAEREEQDQAQKLAMKILTDEDDAVVSLASTLGTSFPRVARILASRWQEEVLDPQAKLRMALVLGSADHEAREYLADRLLEADPGTVRIIAQGLKTIDPQVAVRRFWDLVEDSATGRGGSTPLPGGVRWRSSILPTGSGRRAIAGRS